MLERLFHLGAEVARKVFDDFWGESASGRAHVPRYDGNVVLAALGACAFLAMGSKMTVRCVVAMESARTSIEHPIPNLVVAAAFLVLPGALTLGFSVRSLVRTHRMKRLLLLTASRSALVPEDVAHALGVSSRAARDLMRRAVIDGFVDRAAFAPLDPGTR